MRTTRHAREKDMAISIIFHVDGARPGVDPFGKTGMGGGGRAAEAVATTARKRSARCPATDVTRGETQPL